MTDALVVVVFVAAYVLIATEWVHRVVVALVGAGLMLLFRVVSGTEAFHSEKFGIDWNVIFLLLGMMIIVGAMRHTGLFEYLAIWSAKRAEGRPFRITIMTTSGNAVREQVQQIIKDQMKSVGIDLVIDNRPASVLFGQVTRERRYPHLVMYAWVSGPTTHFRTIWHSGEIPTAANNYVGQNTPGYKNAEVDRLLEGAEGELDEGKRAVLLKKVQELWAEDLPSLPLFFRLELNVSRKDLKNYLPRGIGAPTWNAEAWTY